MSLRDANQDKIITGPEIISAIMGLPLKEQWVASDQVMKFVDTGDDASGAVIFHMAKFIRESKLYAPYLTERELEDRYERAFHRADSYGQHRDKLAERRNRIARLWTQPWVVDWLQTYGQTRTIQEEIAKIAALVDFGTAVLLVNQATLSRAHKARINQIKGRSTKLDVRAEDWRAVRTAIEGGTYNPVVTDEARLAARQARLGRYYLVEPDEGPPPEHCEDAWAAAIQASIKADPQLQQEVDAVMTDMGFAFLDPFAFSDPLVAPAPVMPTSATQTPQEAVTP